MLTRFDADGDDDSQNNKSAAPKGGGHGNTRLPFGLCKRFGIDIGADWGPREAWDALAGKGITADGAYARLKRGEDPGTPDASPEAEATEVTPVEPIPEPPKEPKKTFTVGGREYGDLEGSYSSWSDTPWQVKAKTTDESIPEWRRTAYRRFRTKTDMLTFLKKNGIEEFVDPETGEVINPSEMELPESVMEMTSGAGYYKALSIGVRDGRYTVFGTDFDGKKIKERDFGRLALALEWLKDRGVEEDKVKLSPALKKKEDARLAWTKSDKREWLEEGGEKFGNLRVYKSYDYTGKPWTVEGEAEDGRRKRWGFSTKSEAISFLASQGVDKVIDGPYGYSGEEIDPKAYTPPTEIAKIGDVGYQKLWYKTDYDGRLVIMGKDIDGEEHTIARQLWSQPVEEFKKYASDKGIDTGLVETSPEVQEQIDRMLKEDEERAQRKREFEAKAVSFGGKSRYLNPTLVDDGDGDVKIVGWDEKGEKKNITWGDGLYETVEFCRERGVDPDTLIMDDAIKERYQKFKDTMRDFDAKAVDYRGRKVSDLELGREGDRYVLYGTDYKGRRRAVEKIESYAALETRLSDSGIDPTTVPRTEEATKAYDRYMKAKHALATGEYYSFGGEDAYKDIRVEKTTDTFGEDRYVIKGTDVDGTDGDIDYVDSWDDAVSKLEDMGVKGYKITTGGKERQRPAYGMHNISIRRNKGTGSFTVTASSKRFGDNAVMFEGVSEKECRDWLEKNSVDPDTVATRGMNPHDDVVRTHTAKSLAKFDDHREKEVEKCPTVMKLTSAEKQETADMLTDLFAGSAYRLRANGRNFENIFDTHFKNLLETHTSGGSSYEPGRRETHVRTFGGDYDVRPVDGEKYGYLGDADDYTAYGEYGGSHYGDVMFKFKKDAVGERTTYTFGDTLDTGRPLAGYAGSKPTIEGITGLSGPRDDASGSMRKILKAYKRYKNGEISMTDLRRAIIAESYSSYIECQYHGKLTFADVDTITMSKSALKGITSKLSAEKKAKMLSFFKEHDIKVQYEDGGGLKDGLSYFER